MSIHQRAVSIHHPFRYDRYRNPQTSDGFFFTTMLTHIRTGRRVLTKSVYSPSQGYIGFYTVNLAGDWIVSVQRTGEELLVVYNSLVSVGPVGLNTDPLQVIPGITTGETTVVQHLFTTGMDVSNSNGFADEDLLLLSIAGLQADFLITTYDQFYNQLTQGGEQFVVQVGLLNEGTYVDNDDGTYTSSYMMTIAGFYDLQV
jgi:hypothetical protein